MPYNPDELYIGCSKCNEWYHPKHVGVDENNINVDDWYCGKCNKNNLNNDKSRYKYLNNDQFSDNNLSD